MPRYRLEDTTIPQSTLFVLWIPVRALAARIIFPLDGNAERAQKVEILRGEGCGGARLPACAARYGAGFDGLFRQLVQADGRLQHEQHLVTMTPDVLDHTGDLFGLRDALVDGLSQFLNEFSDFLIQKDTPFLFRASDARKGCSLNLTV